MSSKQPKRKERPGVDRYGRTPLHYCALEGNLPRVKEIVEGGANPNAPDDDGWTPLHFAAQNWHEDVAEWLLSHGADVFTFMFLMIILGSTDSRAPKGFAPIAIGLGLTLIHLIGIPVDQPLGKSGAQHRAGNICGRLGARATPAVLDCSTRGSRARGLGLPPPVPGSHAITNG
jgi:ankyrin repeat protein